MPMLLAALALLAGIKLWLAAELPLFGDESFYWLESRALAPGYSDVPLLTPWLIALGTAVAGQTEFGLRWPFVLLGTALPALVWLLARRIAPVAAAHRAALLVAALPLAATLGVFALPDVPLTIAILATLLAFERAERSGRTRDYVLLGAALALGWLAHYRHLMTYVAAALYVLGTGRGRRQLRSGGFWLAHGIGLLGLLPTLIANRAVDWAGFRFQFVERHPWHFDPGAWIDLPIQMLVTTPVLFALVLLAATRSLQRRLPSTDGAAPYACFGSGLLGAYLIAAFFVDAERLRLHWPLPAYLALLPVLTLWVDGGEGSSSRRRSVWVGAAALIGALGTAGLLGLLLVATQAAGGAWAEPRRPIPDNLQGWHEFGAFAARIAAREPGATLIADQFMTAAQWGFALAHARPVFVLDHPLNEKHGRAAQLRLWNVDQEALAQKRWQRGVLIAEESSRREIERLPALLALCERFARVEVLDELVLFGGRTRFVAFAVERGAKAAPASCRLPALADFTYPLPDARIAAAQFEAWGWAIREFHGVTRVEVLLDGVSVSEARYGEQFDGVLRQWPQSQDPNQPHVGWRALVDLGARLPGTYVLGLRVHATDGSTRDLAQRRVEIAR
jgi:4-amino-4-deoxy-L-arabinose transferase-like glycosyltransferase